MGDPSVGRDRERVLSDDEVTAGLAPISGWAGDHGGITRVVEAPSFLEGVALVAAVAQVAEAMDHHPDIDVRWRTVRLALATHSAGR